ncbi:PspC domain-containing protein [Pseudonocardia bannensis]|uniref:PspC domain-containing protein n=1 Tax=Pseudonocardia bannensis TaxID=630973 RepID=A0A848DPT5_9PSEU|nr:ATP-binding protein [Pseudonocardia bannensis]NMH94401.1 PspC domain-containing protein [Pseudonocardia bannensis]
MSSPAAPVPARTPLVRRRSGRMVAGVAGGVADHLGVEVLWVRSAFVILAAANGAGALAYGLLWVFVRQENADVARSVPRTERQQALGLAALGLGVGLAAAALGSNVIGWIVGPLGVAAVGAAVVWREADESQRRRWAAGARSGVTGVAGGGRTALIRVVAGALFVAAGIGVFLLGNLDLGQLQFGVLAVLATLVGVAVLTVPWWVRLMRDLGEERRERIVEAERAEIAAHLHDSVLQTLALIQRQSDQPREVLRLARGQERELRHWLYGPTGYGRSGVASRGPALDAGLTEALTNAAGEVEDTYALTVSPVVVGGDRPLDDGLRALVLAAREAMVNAAKHAGVDEISVYVEVEADEVHVFVRDRGVGFDPDAVPDDRHGLADSIRGRMARHGGTVRLRSTAGEGTEVHLSMRTEPTAREHAGDNRSPDAPAGPDGTSSPGSTDDPAVNRGPESEREGAAS